jgi:hypothetical protein
MLAVASRGRLFFQKDFGFELSVSLDPSSPPWSLSKPAKVLFATPTTSPVTWRVVVESGIHANTDSGIYVPVPFGGQTTGPLG